MTTQTSSSSYDSIFSMLLKNLIKSLERTNENCDQLEEKVSNLEKGIA